MFSRIKSECANLLFTIAVVVATLLAGSSLVQAQPDGRLVETPASARSEVGTSGDAWRESQRIKANLEMWPARVRQKLKDAGEQLQGLDLHKIGAQRLLARDFEDILNELDQEARAITEAFAKVTTDLRLWKAACSAAPASFRAVADELDKKASQSDDSAFTANYADFAAVARKLAGRYEVKAKSLEKLDQDIRQKLAFVAKSRVFIADVKDFLSTIPADESGLEVEKFIERLNAYVAVFEESIQMLKNLSDQVGDEPKSGSVRTDRSPQTSTAPQRSVELTIDSYRSGLAKLRQPR